MWVYISWLILVPLLAVLIYKTYKQFILVYKAYIFEKKTNFIDQHNYNKLDLNEVKPNYRIPRGQTAFFVFHATNLKKGEKQRKYTGNNKSGIKLPFMNLSLQDKTFYDTNSFSNWGETTITMTNKLVRVVCTGDKPFKKEVKLSDVDEISFVEDNKTVNLSTKSYSWPMRLKFKTKEEANKFQNAFWTLFHTYSRASKSKTKKKQENEVTQLILFDEFA